MNMAIEHQWLAFACESGSQCVKIAVTRVPSKLLMQQATRVVRNAAAHCANFDIDWVCIDEAEPLSRAIECAYSETCNLDELAQRYASLEDQSAVQLDEDQWPVARLLDALLNDAVHYRASDVHVLLDGGQATINYRIDGFLTQRCQLPACLWQGFIARIKVMSELDLTEHRRPQDGAFERFIRGRAQPVRVALIPNAASEKLTLRLLRSSTSLPTLDEVFVLDDHYRSILNALNKRSGLILVAGSTGSGKTTTLYACARQWLSKQLNIITLEDPIEVRLPGICQSSINAGIGYDYADGLRAALRHDPDGILVGEIRDEDACALALRAAITGHPVLASVHASDAIGVFQRLQNLGASLSELQETVQLVITQRLVRSPCACVRESMRCCKCMETGYFGRVAVVELFQPEAIFYDSKRDWPEFRQHLKSELLATIKQLVKEHRIDRNECERLLLTHGGMDATISCKSG